MSDQAKNAAIRQMLQGTPNEAYGRSASRDWTLADFDKALEGVGSYAYTNTRTEWTAILRRLRDQRHSDEQRALSEQAELRRHNEAEAAAALRSGVASKPSEELHGAAEVANERRHAEPARRAEELKDPHWLVVPTFWLTVVSALAAVAAAYFGWRATR